METPRKTILIADDEEDLRMLVEITLEDPAYRIVTAVDGEQAIKQIRQIRPDLVILDWMMPRLNGLEVVKLLRQDSISGILEGNGDLKQNHSHR